MARTLKNGFGNSIEYVTYRQKDRGCFAFSVLFGLYRAVKEKPRYQGSLPEGGATACRDGRSSTQDWHKGEKRALLQSPVATAPSRREPWYGSAQQSLPPRGRWHGLPVTEGVRKKNSLRDNIRYADEIRRRRIICGRGRRPRRPVRINKHFVSVIFTFYGSSRRRPLPRMTALEKWVVRAPPSKPPSPREVARLARDGRSQGK